MPQFGKGALAGNLQRNCEAINKFRDALDTNFNGNALAARCRKDEFVRNADDFVVSQEDEYAK